MFKNAFSGGCCFYVDDGLVTEIILTVLPCMAYNSGCGVAYEYLPSVTRMFFPVLGREVCGGLSPAYDLPIHPSIAITTTRAIVKMKEGEGGGGKSGISVRKVSNLRGPQFV